jgi:hypothetical protein
MREAGLNKSPSRIGSENRGMRSAECWVWIIRQRSHDRPAAVWQTGGKRGARGTIGLPRATCVRGRPWIMRDALTSDGLSQWGFVYLAALVKPTTRAVTKLRIRRDDLPEFKRQEKGLPHHILARSTPLTG